ncbi:MAG: DUF4129 domain-containing protein [Chloroflexota bacterium]
MKIRIEFIQYSLLITGEAAWGYLWSIALGRWFGNGDPTVELHILVGILSLSLISTYLLVARLRRPLVSKLLLPVLGALAVCSAVFFTIPALSQSGRWEETLFLLFNTELGGQAALVAIFAGFFWQRGALLGRSQPDGYVVEEEFRTGIVALISLLVVTALAGEHAPVSGELLVLSTMLFISTGLVGMPLSQIVDVSRASRYRDSAGLTPTVPWLGMLLAIVGGLLTTTLLLAQIFTFDRVSRVWELIRDPLGTVLGVVIQIAALPFAILVEILAFLARLLIPPSDRQPKPRTVEPLWPENLAQEELPPLSPEFIFAIKLLAAVILGALFLWLVIRAISHLGRGWQRDGIEDSRDFVWSWPGLDALWRWLMARLRPMYRIPGLVTRKQRSTCDDGIRKIYREFLSLGALAGRARRPAETPLEYQRRLEADPTLGGHDEVLQLTNSYVQYRYEPPRSKEPDIEGATSALERLRDLWGDKASRS